MQRSIKERMHLFRPLKMACYACYCIQAFYVYFVITGKNNSTRSCVREFPHRDDILSILRYCFHQELPQRMLTRVHIISRLLLVEIWKCPGRPSDITVEDLKPVLSSWPSCAVSISSFLEFLCSSIALVGLCVAKLYLMFHQPMNVCFFSYFLSLQCYARLQAVACGSSWMLIFFIVTWCFLLA